ncbi:MAG: ABC transporter ATP-binding protein [Hyphomicrobium sp.]|jgi:lipopolysaccharide transport system ATP-binding protein
MSSELAIRVRDLTKHYLMFDRPEDRLKQMIVPRLERLAGRTPRRYYRDFAALNGVSFEVRRGETVGIIGRNGCGKSTLLQIVCGTLQPTAGTVEVNGRIAALLELGAGFNPEFTGRENVFLNASILGLQQAEIEARFDAIARFADIGLFIDQPVKTYSSGMYVRLAFATAINVDPDILVVDEALSVGDEAFQRKCFARIEDIKDKGGTILFVSHGAQTIVQLCDRAMLFDRGEKILEGRPKTVVTQYQRLVNASAEGAAEIRAGIIAMRDAPPEPAAPAPAEALAEADAMTMAASAGSGVALAEKPPVVSATDVAPAAPEKDDGLADYFDPDLQPQSTIYFEERGARIYDARITTLTGKPVNVLRLGKRYVFEYYAHFTSEATGVGFGMFVTNSTGLGLAGAQTMLSSVQRTQRVAARATAGAAFEFTCGFLPGCYFFTVGVRGSVAGEFRLLHRVEDAVMFRVAEEGQTISVGRFSIDPIARISVAGSSPDASGD